MNTVQPHYNAVFGVQKTDRVTCEPRYNEVIYYMHYRKIVIWDPCRGRVILEIVL